MPDTGRMRQAWGDNKYPEEYAYYDEVVRRLEKAVGPWLSLADCRAMTDVLEWNQLVYDDGFIIGEDADGNNMILGNSTASVIAWCFLDPGKENFWMKRRLRKFGSSLLRSDTISNEAQQDVKERAGRILREILSTSGARLKETTYG
jgi:hypothetical protein